MNMNNNNGVEVKSPILKNGNLTRSNLSVNNFSNNPQSTNQPSTQKYSSLIDTQNQNQHQHQSTSRPNSAMIIKGRHNREASINSLKNEKLNSSNNISSMPRSPSTNNINANIPRTYSKGSISTQKKETPKHNYITNFDSPKNILLQGHNTVRPSSNYERGGINYINPNKQPINDSNNYMNNRLNTPTGRYVGYEHIKRGYSLSSRANDNKGGYSYNSNSQNEMSKYSSIGNKFSAGIYRSNSQAFKK